MGRQNEYQRKLASNHSYHMMQHGLTLLVGVWLRASQTAISTTQWAHMAQEELPFCFLSHVGILTHDIDIVNLSVCPSVCL